MAAIYDELGNYVGDDGVGDNTPAPAPKPAVDPEVARLLARYPAPGVYDRPIIGGMSPRQILGGAIKKGFEVKNTLGDVGRLGVSYTPPGVIPMLQAVGEAGVNDINKRGSEALYNLVGDQQNAARVAKEREQLPTIDDLMKKYYAPLQMRTPGGQAVQEGVNSFLVDTLKLPPVMSGPRGSGFVASGERRPMLTPNDARALLGEASYAASEAKQIPTDVSNYYRSGITRISPVTGEESIGSTIAKSVESPVKAVQDYKEWRAENARQAELEKPFWVPERGAVRTDKSIAIVPKVPPTVNQNMSVGPFDSLRQRAEETLNDMGLGNVGGDTSRDYHDKYLAMAPAAVKNALKAFNETDATQMFPTAASVADAIKARDTLYSDPNAKEQYNRDLFSRFAQANPQFNLPTFDEHQQRVDAARQMLHEQYVPWVAKHAGTPSDPQLLLAQEGKTVIEPEKLLDRASSYPITHTEKMQRINAGFPVEGTTYAKRLELQSQLDAAKQAADASYAIYAAQAGAAGPGQSAHRMFPDFDANRAQAEKDASVVKDLEQKVENTTLGQAYEDLVDQLVTPFIASDAQSRIKANMQQFYPKLMKQGPDQTVYSIGSAPLDTMALGRRVAEDIMSGKIPLDVAPKLIDFTPMVRKYGAEQATAYAKRKEAAKNFVANANTRLKSIVDQVPKDQHFGKLGAIFLDDNMSIEQIDRLASDDTALLDHCIGEAGQKRATSKLTGRTHGYVPMYNTATGELEPNATRNHTRYAERISQGRYVVASLRDLQTGYPITTISWHPTNNDTWQTEYLSGFNNQEAIKPEYHDSIKQFLNSISEGNGPLGLSNFKIDSIGELENKYKLYDKNDKSSLSFARASLGTAEKEALKANPDVLQQLPRFFNANDLKQVIATPAPTAAATTTDNARSLQHAKDILLEELNSLVGTGVSFLDLQPIIDDIDHEIADIDARLARVTPDAIASYVAAQQRQAPAQSITRDDVVRTLVETQLAIDPDAVGLQNLVFSGTVDFDPNNPVQSLRNVREYLTQHVTDATNDRHAPGRTIDALNAVVSNGMIPRLNELIAELSPAQQQPATGLLQQARDAIFPLIGNEHPVPTRAYIHSTYRALDDIAEQYAGNEPFADTTARLIQALDNARQHINDNTQARLNVGTNNADYIDNVLGTAQNRLEEQQFIRQQTPQQAPAMPERRMAQITREQADVMPYAELAAAVGDPARYDDIVARALREIRMNESPASEVVDTIIGGGHIGNHDLSMMTAVERELIARDVTDAARALETARAAPRSTLRQDMVSAYVNALQHPTESVNTALQSIRNVMDDITIERQGNGESVNEIGNALLEDLNGRIRGIQGAVDRGEALQGLTPQGTSAVLLRLIDAREQVAQAFIRDAEQQAAQARAQRQEQSPRPQNPLPDIGDFIQTLRRTEGLQVAERVETVAFRVAENITPTANPLGYAQGLRSAAHHEESELVERNLNALADAFEESHIGEIVNAMEPDEGQPANWLQPRGPSWYIESIQPTINNLSNELFYMDVSPEGVPNAPAIANTIFALRNGTVDHAAFRAMPEAERQNAMNAVANEIEGRLTPNTPPVVEPTEQEADLFRDVYSRPHGTDHVYVSDEQAGHIIDDEMRNVFRNYGQDVGERVSRAIEDMMDHMSFEDDPHGVIQHLRRNTIVGRNGSLTVRANAEQAMQDIAQRLEEEFTAAFNEHEQQRMQSAPVPRGILNMSDDELERHLTPADIGQIDASFEAMMQDNNGFAAEGAPTLSAAAMLTRRFNVYDLDAPSREALARRFEAEERRRQQPQQPQQQTARSVRQLYDLFNDAVANAIEEGSYDPDMDSNENMAQLVLDDAIGGELENLTDGERQALADVVRRRGYRGDLGEDINDPPTRLGYAKGGLVMPVSKHLGNPTLAGLTYKYGGYLH